MVEPEFKVGDTVHYRGASDHPVAGIPAIVREIRVGMFGGFHLDGTPDSRIFYSLRGDRDRSNPATRNVVTHVTGRCLLESSLYEPPTPD